MESASLHVRIAQRIAACEDVDAAALDPPLHAVVDADALENLIGSHPHERRDFTGTVSFTYRNYTVTVDHTGAVSVAASMTGNDRSVPVSKTG
ncbi:HalOD1 output domain-containing protein [Halosolutus gelatinilyticus]|uniref:HalOD1 output domain-containing protein n=1 Tax=Halosolutus gelatinilyticus TaxID=2931975 RepID=UPI001FF40605|nr:HalOD1 output domain-containing protein [Halosolutus gelatinilyticus]